MTPRITVAIVLAALLMPLPASTQQVTVADFGPERGMVRDSDGELWAPSPAYALQSLDDGTLAADDWKTMAGAILRRVHGTWPEEELAAFANALADAIVADELDKVQHKQAEVDLSLVLWEGAETDEGSKLIRLHLGIDQDLSEQTIRGTASSEVLDAMIHVYEELEAAWRRNDAHFPEAQLMTILMADPTGRGGAYVRGVFDVAEPPPPGLTIGGKPSPETGKYTWCKVGEYLYGDANSNRWSSVVLAEFGTPPLLTDSEAKDYDKLCGTGPWRAVR